MNRIYTTAINTINDDSNLDNSLSMAIVESTKDKEVPDNFTICIGDCTMYGYIETEWISF